MAFQIVKHGSKTFHVYGSGKNRQVIEVGAHRKAAANSGTQPTQSTGTATTGGTSATTTGTATTGSAGTTIAPADTIEPSGTPPASP
jgi:hypothetical protein